MTTRSTKPMTARSSRSVSTVGNGSTDTFSVYAFKSWEEPPAGDERRDGIPHWRIGEAVYWALGRGHDNINIQATPGVPASSSRSITHHVCNDPWCPGGCT